MLVGMDIHRVIHLASREEPADITPPPPPEPEPIPEGQGEIWG